MDKFQEAVEYLVLHPEKIRENWSHPNGKVVDGEPIPYPAGILFRYLGEGCGCLTQIKYDSIYPDDSYPYRAWSDEVTQKIAKDDRIPANIDEITHLRGDELRAKLQVFVEYQMMYEEARANGVDRRGHNRRRNLQSEQKMRHVLFRLNNQANLNPNMIEKRHSAPGRLPSDIDGDPGEAQCPYCSRRKYIDEMIQDWTESRGRFLVCKECLNSKR